MQMELLEPDSIQSGQLRKTFSQQQFSGKGFQPVNSSKQISEQSQMTLFDVCQYQTYLSPDFLAKICPWLAAEKDLLAIAQACFLSSSDFCEFSSLRIAWLRMCSDSSTATTGRTLRQFCGASPKWGMWGLGKFGMDGAGYHKTDKESLLWVLTGNVQCWKIEPDRPTLSECLDGDGIALNSVTSKPIDESFTLRANSYKSGSGNHQHPTPVILDQHLDDDHIYEDQVPTLRTPTTGGTTFAVMYCSASGDRLCPDESPTLRSLANTGGNHQGGSGAWKVVEYKNEEYVVTTELPEETSALAATEAYIKTGARPRRVKDGKPSLIPMGYRRQRPLSATEFERLMGWPVGCTEKGTTVNGKEIVISKTQRQKICGNGIIPQEVEDICSNLKSFLEKISLQPTQAPSPKI